MTWLRGWGAKVAPLLDQFLFSGKFRFGYVESLTLQIVQLDYAGKEFSMIILLPENFDLHAVEQQLNYDNLTNWISTMDYQNIDVSGYSSTLINHTTWKFLR